MKSLMQTPRLDEPFTLPGLLIDFAALAAIGLFVAVATAFILGVG